MIFVDSDAYLGLNGEKDPHYTRACKLSKFLLDHDESLVTSWEVVDEVTTKLSYFTNKEIANIFLKHLLSSDTRIEYVTPMHVPLIQLLFAKQTSKKVSLTDCANMVIARQLGVKTFFSFDHHYEQNGFTLLS